MDDVSQHLVRGTGELYERLDPSELSVPLNRNNADAAQGSRCAMTTGTFSNQAE